VTPKKLTIKPKIETEAGPTKSYDELLQLGVK